AMGFAMLTTERLLAERTRQVQAQVTDRLAAMGTVAAGVAHEINNPLAFVISNLEFALEELRDVDPEHRAPLDEEVITALDAARRGSDRVRRIVLNLKAMSRSEDESTRRVEVNGAIASAAAMLDDQIRRCARLQLDLGDVPAVPATEARIAQVLLSLLQNAVQAIEPGQPDAH